MRNIYFLVIIDISSNKKYNGKIISDLKLDKGNRLSYFDVSCL